MIATRTRKELFDQCLDRKTRNRKFIDETTLLEPSEPIWPIRTVSEILRDQNHFFAYNFAGIPNQKLENVLYESYEYPTF